jgi:flagellar hook-associated protein 3
MGFRVTPSSMFGRAKYDLAASFSRLARVQNQISSGKRIQSVSEDTAAASRALDLRRTVLATLKSRDAVSAARTATDQQASLLQDISGLIVDARARAQEAAKGSNSPSDLTAIANEIDSILDQVLALGNQRTEGRYVFAGSKVNTVPFVATRSFGSITAITYQGDDASRRVRLGPNDLKSIELSGNEAFFRFSREPTIVTSNTGLDGVLGASDTMTGSAKIVLTHTQTVFGDGAVATTGDSVSGLKPGTSTANDTILGPAGEHSITVVSAPGGGGTLQLDGGTAVEFSGTETNLAVTSGSGDVVHVDVTALTSGFSGNVALTGNGQIALDGGTPQNLTFAADMAIQSADGRVVHVNTSEVFREGEALLTFGGTQSIFDALIELRDEIRGSNAFGATGRVERIQARAGVLDKAHTLLLAGASDLGSRSQGFERLENSLDLISLSLQTRESELIDTDLVDASLELSESEAAYQSALASAARLNRPTLLNYL